MEFEKLIEERYSVRSFKPEHLPKTVIDKILDAGHKAPTGCNFQPQRILVLNTDEAIEKLKGCTKCHFGAPTAMLICHNSDESWKRVYDGALSSPDDVKIRPCPTNEGMVFFYTQIQYLRGFRALFK